MKVTSQIFILFSFLTFKLIFGENSCITTYDSNVYLIETNTTLIHIKSFQPSLPSNKNTLIQWQNVSETQQGVASLFSCTTVHHYLLLLISPTIPFEQQQQQSNDGENVKRILTFDYDSHQWKTIPLYLELPSSTLITSSWNTHYIVYNTQKRTTYYFDTQPWSWHSSDDQNDTQSPPLSTTNTPQMATVNSTLYYFFNDAGDHHQNHIFTFDLMTEKWNGHFASFWSNDSSFYFSSDHINSLYAIPRWPNSNDQFMRTIRANLKAVAMIQSPIMKWEANDLVTSLGGDLVLYNGTRLAIYQPATNTISSIYGQENTIPPDFNSTTPQTSPSFWSTSEGERIKIALGCSLGVGMALMTVIGMILLRNRRRRELLDDDTSAPAIQEANQEASVPTRTTKLSTSMQSLSFLNRDNAMVWSKHVHQLLALISFRRHQEEEEEKEKEKEKGESEEDVDYPSMIKTSSTVSVLAMSSMILSIISSSSYSIAAINNNNVLLTPSQSSTPMNRRSLDMACPLPRNSWGQAESSSSPQK